MQNDLSIDQLTLQLSNKYSGKKRNESLEDNLQHTEQEI